MARKRILLSLSVLLLTLAFSVGFTAYRIANAAPLPKVNEQARISDAEDNQVYLSSTGTSITALNAATGATIWSFQSGPPIIVKHIVYTIGAPYPTLYALDLNTGATLWTFHPNDGYVNVPVVNNAVYITVDSVTLSDTTLYKLNASTGATIWTFQPGAQLSSAAVISNGVVYISSAYVGPIYALQASDGKQLWQSQPTSGQLSAHTVAGGVLYVDGEGPKDSFGVLYAYSIKDGSMLWSTDAALETVVNNITFIEAGTYANPEICALNPEQGTQLWCIAGYELSVADGLAYVTTSLTALTVLNASNGMQVWSSNQNQFVTLNKGVVYTVNANNAIAALNARNGAMLWSSAVKNGVSTAFLIANDKIYTESANNTALYSLDGTNGALRWSFPFSSGVSSLTIASGTLFIMTYNNTVYALQASNGKLLWQH